tara:strand:+ start:328 stop:516 length:189 start_codon:yes stop_codon:yes gene_type:complete
MKIKNKKYKFSFSSPLNNWPYGSGDVLENKQYLQDRRELLKEHGNGWWWEESPKEQFRRKTN